MIPSELLSAIDNKRSLANFSNSILKGMGVTPFHEDIPEITNLVSKHKKVCVMLFDGMGSYLLDTHKDVAKDLLAHKFTEIHAINPATTAASTIAVLTAKFPQETGWLGWSIPLKECGGLVDVFPNVRSDTKEAVAPNAMRNACPIKTIDKILIEGGVRARLSYRKPVEDASFYTLKEMMKVGTDYFKKGDGFLYLYYNDPDGFIHGHGVKHRKVHKEIKAINKYVHKFAKANPDVLVLVIADHGLIDVIYRDISPFSNLTSLFRAPMGIEGRMRAIYLKEGVKEDFIHKFNAVFSHHFYVVDSLELLEAGYFGEGELNPRTKEFLGDLLIIPKDDSLLYDSTFEVDGNIHVAHHAGPSEKERSISVLVYNQ